MSFVLHFVHVMHFISCHHVHCFCIRVRLAHPSVFPVVRFAIRRSYLLRCTPLVFFRVRVSNFLGMDQRLSSGLLIYHPETTGQVSFHLEVVWYSKVNRASAKSICVLQQNPPKNQPKTHQTLFHALGRSITIVWAKTAPHLDTPTSL